MTDEAEKAAVTFKTVSRIIELLDPLDPADREHVFRTVGTWFRIGTTPAVAKSTMPTERPIFPSPDHSEEDKFSDRPVSSAKDFILEKDPLTEVERLACLAYYLTHYLSTPHFKTVDLSRL